MKQIVCNVSGGRSSALMVYVLENYEQYKGFEKHYIFANTSKELTRTILFLKNIEFLFDVKITLIEANVSEEKGTGTTYSIIDSFSKLNMDGDVYESVISKYGLPSVAAPHCTRELKIQPIKKFIKEHLCLNNGDYVQAIGFRFDELKRIKNKPDFIYPLADAGITKKDVVDFWSDPCRIKYDLGLDDFEGNCDFCFKKSWAKLKTMYKKYPDRLNWWARMEDKYYEPNFDFFRGHKVANDLINDSEFDENDLNCACAFSDDFF